MFVSLGKSGSGLCRRMLWGSKIAPANSSLIWFAKQERALQQVPEFCDRLMYAPGCSSRSLWGTWASNERRRFIIQFPITSLSELSGLEAVGTQGTLCWHQLSHCPPSLPEMTTRNNSIILNKLWKGTACENLHEIWKAWGCIVLNHELLSLVNVRGTGAK